MTDRGNIKNEKSFFRTWLDIVGLFSAPLYIGIPLLYIIYILFNWMK